MPIGAITDLIITEHGLEVVARVVKSAPASVYGLIQQGVLKTFSVGMRVLDADWDSHSEIFLIKDLELLEISVVSVPCNQDSTFSLEKSLSHKDYLSLREQFGAKNNKTDLELFLEKEYGINL